MQKYSDLYAGNWAHSYGDYSRDRSSRRRSVIANTNGVSDSGRKSRKFPANNRQLGNREAGVTQDLHAEQFHTGNWTDNKFQICETKNYDVDKSINDFGIPTNGVNLTLNRPESNYFDNDAEQLNNWRTLDLNESNASEATLVNDGQFSHRSTPTQQAFSDSFIDNLRSSNDALSSTDIGYRVRQAEFDSNGTQCNSSISYFCDDYYDDTNGLYDDSDVSERNKQIMHDAQRRILGRWMDAKTRIITGKKIGKKSNEVEDGNIHVRATEDPPPLPPRRNRQISSLKRTRRYRSGDKDRVGPTGDDVQMVCTRSPAVRKRDAMQRRYNSSSALLETQQQKTAPDSTRERANSDVSVTVSDSSDATNGDPFEPNDIATDCTQQCHNSTCAEFPTEEQSRYLGQLDIVGETFRARYPWQRDVAIQCDLACLSFRARVGSSRNSSDSGNSTEGSFCLNGMTFDLNNHVKSPAMSRTARPHSIGGIENEFVRMKKDRRARLSDPLLQTLPNRKRMPIMVPDDAGSVSDLESILENPRENSTDALRHPSSTPRDELLSVDKLHPQTDSYLGVLPSPRVSPEMWKAVPDVIVNTDPEHGVRDCDNLSLTSSGGSQFLSVPVKPSRRRSSGSITSGSDESDHEPSPPVARRGRRAAIVDTKNFGDVSPTTLSPDVSPSNSCDEGENGGNIAGRLRRRRSSVDLAMNVYPGDLLVQEHHKKLIKRNTISDFYANRNGSTPVLNDENKKRQTFSLLKLMKTRSKESLTRLGDILQKMKPSEFKDNHLAAYKTVHWSDLIASTDKQSSVPESLRITEVERKRRESVWELFKSECVFLIDHLMVLKHCFLEPLKKVQVDGFLMYAEPSEIFSNLDELCYVSYTFCKDFISALLKDMSNTDFGRTSVLIKAFQRFSTHSKDGSVYHTYCLNYTNALTYLEKLRKSDDFCEFEKWCEQDPRCNRLQLADLLIGPMQHCTKLPLLLHNIKKYTENPVDKQEIVNSIEKMETSLQQLEDKMKWLKNFERVQEIQRHLVWPSVTDLDSRAFIPEHLKPKLMRQPCERLLACPRRQLLQEGAVMLTESAKTFDAYLFLFDDILLITKIKKPNRKKQTAADMVHSSSNQPDRQTYTVHRQPLALDRVGIHDVGHQEAAANGLKFAFVIVQISRFQQIIDVFTLQASSDMCKNTWIGHIRDAKKIYCNKCLSTSKSHDGETNNNDKENRRSSGSKKFQHGKSLSVDAVFL